MFDTFSMSSIYTHIKKRQQTFMDNPDEWLTCMSAPVVVISLSVSCIRMLSVLTGKSFLVMIERRCETESCLGSQAETFYMFCLLVSVCYELLAVKLGEKSGFGSYNWKLQKGLQTCMLDAAFSHQLEAVLAVKFLQASPTCIKI